MPEYMDLHIVPHGNESIIAEVTRNSCRESILGYLRQNRTLVGTYKASAYGQSVYKLTPEFDDIVVLTSSLTNSRLVPGFHRVIDFFKEQFRLPVVVYANSKTFTIEGYIDDAIYLWYFMIVAARLYDNGGVLNADEKLTEVNYFNQLFRARYCEDVFLSSTDFYHYKAMWILRHHMRPKATDFIGNSGLLTYARSQVLGTDSFMCEHSNIYGNRHECPKHEHGAVCTALSYVKTHPLPPR